jgi:hypothetical protein
MGIQGNTSLMLMEIPPSHPHHAKLRQIEEQIASAANLTRQLLGFARGGRFEVKPTAIQDIIRKSIAMFGRTQKHVIVHDRLPADLWTVEVDRDQMEQVFMNLFVNAGQAMAAAATTQARGENCLMDEIQASRFEISPGPYVKLSVSDTGTAWTRRPKPGFSTPSSPPRRWGGERGWAWPQSTASFGPSGHDPCPKRTRQGNDLFPVPAGLGKAPGKRGAASGPNRHPGQRNDSSGG